jgi:hypothetical protein
LAVRRTVCACPLADCLAPRLRACLLCALDASWLYTSAQLGGLSVRPHLRGRVLASSQLVSEPPSQAAGRGVWKNPSESARQLPLQPRRVKAMRCPSGDWSADDFDVATDGAVVGHIFKANAAPVGSPWMWTLIFPHQEGRSPTHGYEATRDAAMAAANRRQSCALPDVRCEQFWVIRRNFLRRRQRSSLEQQSRDLALVNSPRKGHGRKPNPT